MLFEQFLSSQLVVTLSAGVLLLYLDPLYKEKVKIFSIPLEKNPNSLGAGRKGLLNDEGCSN